MYFGGRKLKFRLLSLPWGRVWGIAKNRLLSILLFFIFQEHGHTMLTDSVVAVKSRAFTVAFHNVVILCIINHLHCISFPSAAFYSRPDLNFILIGGLRFKGKDLSFAVNIIPPAKSYAISKSFYAFLIYHYFSLFSVWFTKGSLNPFPAVSYPFSLPQEDMMLNLFCNII